MTQYCNKGRFGLWRNKDRKELTHPHLSGQGEALDGSACWVSAWFSKDLDSGDKQVLTDMVKRYEGTSTKPFINIVIRPKQQNQEQPQAAPAMVDDGFDDDIPF